MSDIKVTAASLRGYDEGRADAHAAGVAEGRGVASSPEARKWREECDRRVAEAYRNGTLDGREAGVAETEGKYAEPFERMREVWGDLPASVKRLAKEAGL